MAHVECKYCDSCFPPRTIEGTQVCGNCGAEWADARMVIKDEEEA
jgi:ribosomal protein L37AE/L43A